MALGWFRKTDETLGIAESRLNDVLSKIDYLEQCVAAINKNLELYREAVVKLTVAYVNRGTFPSYKVFVDGGWQTVHNVSNFDYKNGNIILRSPEHMVAIFPENTSMFKIEDE